MKQKICDWGVFPGDFFEGVFIIIIIMGGCLSQRLQTLWLYTEIDGLSQVYFRLLRTIVKIV
jgi:hypothetical protein